ncbi:hypothetical protein [Mesorhizobium sp. CA16]|uniref:hypothetical protein n=1 Tax=Mesorhizobium sp. CA16 TaxID=588496 RepID=UPI001CCE2592|nr:hypothetical protein [Mesorhizobium sp. CA16]MBZ9915833.1 hypothetical protein [Mesorhizobium sp. CA16]
MGNRRVAYSALAVALSVTQLPSALSQTLDPRKDPTNILRSLDGCKTEALISGQQTAQLLLGKLAQPYNVQLGRARVSRDVAVDYCVSSARYTETFKPGGQPQDWEIAGPELQRMVSDLGQKYNSTKFKLEGKEAVLYSTGKSQTLISLFRGTSEREIGLTIGIASNPIPVRDFDEQSECEIDGIATITFKGVVSYTGHVAEPGTVWEAMCANRPAMCQKTLVPFLNREEGYKSMLFAGGKGFYGDLRAKFLNPLSYEIKAADGIFVLDEPWPGAKVQWLADSSSTSLSLFANGKKVASGICKFK